MLTCYNCEIGDLIPLANSLDEIDSRSVCDNGRETDRLLYNLGLSANYSGFHYITTAVKIAAEPLSHFTMVTKWLYPQVAKHCQTSWRAVEKNIRTALKIIWMRNASGLQKLSGFALDSNHLPQFISLSILSNLQNNTF